MDKRKLAGALSLGAVAAGTGSTALAEHWYSSNPFKKVSEKIKALTKSVDHDLNKNHDESKKNEKGYGAALTIAYRIYTILVNTFCSLIRFPFNPLLFYWFRRWVY